MNNQDIINKYNELFADMNDKDIKILELGFIKDNCNSMLFGILIHCMENIEIFNETQTNNINHFIHRLRYA